MPGATLTDMAFPPGNYGNQRVAFEFMSINLMTVLVV
jgi:hypothetical protein